LYTVPGTRANVPTTRHAYDGRVHRSVHRHADGTTDDGAHAADGPAAAAAAAKTGCADVPSGGAGGNGGRTRDAGPTWLFHKRTRQSEGVPLRSPFLFGTVL